MNKKLLLAGLSISFALSPALVAEASDNAEITATSTEAPKNMPIDKIPEDSINRIFVVKEINEEGTSAVLYEEGNEKSEYVLDLGQFRDDDVKVNNRYKIYWNGVAFTSYPAKFGHIYRVEKLESLDEKDKFENMPIDKLPEDHESMEFELLEINKDDEKPMATLAEVGNPDNKYVIKLDMLLDEYAGVGDLYKIYWDGISLKSYPAQFGKIYRVEKVKLNHYDDSYTKDLAISMFDALVNNQAASILLEQSPKTVEKIKPSLEELMGETNELMEEAYSVFMTEEEKLEGNKDVVIIKIIQYKYNKKLESISDQELAKSIFQNMIMTNAGRMLLEKTPKTVKSIEKELKEKVENSEKLVEEAINTLK